VGSESLRVRNLFRGIGAKFCVRMDLAMDPTRPALICACRLRFMDGSCESALVYYN
jgi:hypothetical protein